MSLTQANQHTVKSETPDNDKYGPYFGWVNTDTIRDTFKHTTQWGVSTESFPMHRHLKLRNPALNVPCRHEAVATDTAVVRSRCNSLLVRNPWNLISTP